MNAGLYKRATGRRPGSLPADFYFALGLAIISVIANTYAQIAEFSRVSEFGTLTSSTIAYLYLVIETGLVVNLIGLYHRTATGLRVSIIALLSVVAGYAFWYIYSRQILESVLSNPAYQTHAEAVPDRIFGLMGATWLNLAVLIMSGVLLLWEMKTLRGKVGH